MKKILVWLLTLCMAVAPALSLAEEEVEMDTQLEGFVTEILEEAFVLEDAEHGEVMLNTSENTVWDGVLMEQELAVGQYVIVDYDGRMTFSLPPQAHADRVGCYLLEGFVTEITEDGQILMDDLTFGEVFVQMEDGFEHVYAGMAITVYYDGVMSLSLPALANGRHISVPEITGAVSELTEEGFLLTDEAGQPWQIHFSDETVLSELLPVAEEEIILEDAAELAVEEEIAEEEISEEAEATVEEENTEEETAEEITEESEDETVEKAVEDETVLELADGDVVTVYYNGASTRSLPPQLTAMEVLIHR